MGLYPFIHCSSSGFYKAFVLMLAVAWGNSRPDPTMSLKCNNSCSRCELNHEKHAKTVSSNHTFCQSGYAGGTFLCEHDFDALLVYPSDEETTISDYLDEKDLSFSLK